MIEGKFKVRLRHDGGLSSDESRIDVLGRDGELVDPSPFFKRVVIELEGGEPVVFRAEMYADHLNADVTVEVGTLAAFGDDEIMEEFIRRGLRPEDAVVF